MYPTKVSQTRCTTRSNLSRSKTNSAETRMRRSSGIAIALLLAAPVSAQAPSDAVNAIFKSFASDQTPGCAIGVRRGDAVAAAGGYGMADLEHGVRLTPESVFYMASVSKEFTALSVLLLERDGKLQLDDRVR